MHQEDILEREELLSRPRSKVKIRWGIPVGIFILHLLVKGSAMIDAGYGSYTLFLLGTVVEIITAAALGALVSLLIALFRFRDWSYGQKFLSSLMFTLSFWILVYTASNIIIYSFNVGLPPQQ